MSVSKNWEAIAIKGIAGNEIIVKGAANVGMLDVMPELEKRVPQGTNSSILQLSLLMLGMQHWKISSLFNITKKL
jgi:hypothetical protein